MGWVRDICGGIGTGLATILLFGGGPILGLVGSSSLDQDVVVRPVAAGPPVWLPPAPAPEPEPEPEAEPAPDLPAREAVVARVAPVVSTGARRPVSARPDEVKVERKRKGRRCEPDPIPEIEQHGATMYSVDRSLIKTYTRDFSKLDDLGWSKQHDGPDGKPDGLVIGGVRCNNDAHRAGLRSGDVVHTVNGHRIHNIPQALGAYLAVRNDHVIRLDITRRGERMMLAYRLRG